MDMLRMKGEIVLHAVDFLGEGCQVLLVSGPHSQKSLRTEVPLAMRTDTPSMDRADFRLVDTVRRDSLRGRLVGCLD